jgi:hypothetical protein
MRKHFINVLHYNSLLIDNNYDKNDLVYLDISNNYHVKNGDLDEFINLKFLIMQNINSKDISNGFLDKLHKLEHLEMQFCNNISIKDGFLDKLVNL